MNIDFGYTDTKYNPLNRRNSIALLLGAGFSVPKGYPTANQLNLKSATIIQYTIKGRFMSR